MASCSTLDTSNYTLFLHVCAIGTVNAQWTILNSQVTVSKELNSNRVLLSFQVVLINKWKICLQCKSICKISLGVQALFLVHNLCSQHCWSGEFLGPVRWQALNTAGILCNKQWHCSVVSILCTVCVCSSSSANTTSVKVLRTRAGQSIGVLVLVGSVLWAQTNAFSSKKIFHRPS